MKKPVTQFDLAAAFKALDEIDYGTVESNPVKNSKKLNESLLKETCKRITGRKLNIERLVEDYYDLDDEQDLNQAAEDREAEIAQAKLSRIEKIVDLDAKTADELLPSYVGKVIIRCPQCMNMFYKNEEDIVKDEEDPTTCNVNEPCQHCGNISGYEIIGKVDKLSPEDTAQLSGDEEAPAEGEEDLDLDLDATEEEAPAEEGEATEEGTDEDLDLDLDLDLEEPAQESLNASKAAKSDFASKNETENKTLTEANKYGRSDDEDYYAQDINDAVMQLKKTGHAEFWCRQGKAKADQVIKTFEDRYGKKAEYTIDDDYCTARVIKSKKESIKESLDTDLLNELVDKIPDDICMDLNVDTNPLYGEGQGVIGDILFDFNFEEGTIAKATELVNAVLSNLDTARYSYQIWNPNVLSTEECQSIDEVVKATTEQDEVDLLDEEGYLQISIYENNSAVDESLKEGALDDFAQSLDTPANSTSTRGNAGKTLDQFAQNLGTATRNSTNKGATNSTLDKFAQHVKEGAEKPLKESSASQILAAFEASLSDDNFDAPVEESVNKAEVEANTVPETASENKSINECGKNCKPNQKGKLKEAVAITIGVNEVDDEVVANGPADAMIVAEPNAVAVYDQPEFPEIKVEPQEVENPFDQDFETPAEFAGEPEEIDDEIEDEPVDDEEDEEVEESLQEGIFDTAKNIVKRAGSAVKNTITSAKLDKAFDGFFITFIQKFKHDKNKPSEIKYIDCANYDEAKQAAIILSKKIASNTDINDKYGSWVPDDIEDSVLNNKWVQIQARYKADGKVTLIDSYINGEQTDTGKDMLNWALKAASKAKPTTPNKSTTVDTTKAAETKTGLANRDAVLNKFNQELNDDVEESLQEGIFNAVKNAGSAFKNTFISDKLAKCFDRFCVRAKSKDTRFFERAVDYGTYGEAKQGAIFASRKRSWADYEAVIMAAPKTAAKIGPRYTVIDEYANGKQTDKGKAELKQALNAASGKTTTQPDTTQSTAPQKSKNGLANRDAVLNKFNQELADDYVDESLQEGIFDTAKNAVKNAGSAFKNTFTSAKLDNGYEKFYVRYNYRKTDIDNNSRGRMSEVKQVDCTDYEDAKRTAIKVSKDVISHNSANKYSTPSESNSLYLVDILAKSKIDGKTTRIDSYFNGKQTDKGKVELKQALTTISTTKSTEVEESLQEGIFDNIKNKASQVKSTIKGKSVDDGFDKWKVISTANDGKSTTKDCQSYAEARNYAIALSKQMSIKQAIIKATDTTGVETAIDGYIKGKQPLTAKNLFKKAQLAAQGAPTLGNNLNLDNSNQEPTPEGKPEGKPTKDALIAALKKAGYKDPSTIKKIVNALAANNLVTEAVEATEGLNEDLASATDRAVAALQTLTDQAMSTIGMSDEEPREELLADNANDAKDATGVETIDDKYQSGGFGDETPNTETSEIEEAAGKPLSRTAKTPAQARQARHTAKTNSMAKTTNKAEYQKRVFTCLQDKIDDFLDNADETDAVYTNYSIWVDNNGQYTNEVEENHVEINKALDSILAYINNLTPEDKAKVGLSWTELEADGTEGDLVVSVYGPSEGEDTRTLSNYPDYESKILDALSDGVNENLQEDVSDAEYDQMLNSKVFKDFNEEINIDDIDEIDEESVNECTTNYLKEVYSNVDKFELTKADVTNGILVLEGLIKFHSGKTRNTTFGYNLATGKHLAFSGVNEDLAKNGQFNIQCSLNNKSLVVESLAYSHEVNGQLVEGLVHKN